MADSDLNELRKLCINSLYLCTDNVSKYLETDKKESEYRKLKSYVEEYCLLEAQQEVANQALERSKRETDHTNVDRLHECFANHLSSMAENRLNVQRHPYMLELDKHIQRGREMARANLDESDLAITASQDIHLDPITKKPIEDPVKNKICGHVYEKEVIFSLVNERQRVKCPVAGCGNRQHIITQHLISDDELKFRMRITQHSTMIQERSIMDLDNSQ